MDAHKHFRNGDNKETIVSANKAFESVCKSICTAKGWALDRTNNSVSKLIATMCDNNLIPAYMQSHVGALRSVLESGVPTVRNRDAAHGQGPVPTDVPDHYAAFVLHLTASNIVFLISSYESSM